MFLFPKMLLCPSVAWKKMNCYATSCWQMTSNRRKLNTSGASGACRSLPPRPGETQSGRSCLIVFCQLRQIEISDSAQDWLNIFGEAAASCGTLCYSERPHHRMPFKFRFWCAIKVYQLRVDVMHARSYWCCTPIPSVHQVARRSHYEISQTITLCNSSQGLRLNFPIGL